MPYHEELRAVPLGTLPAGCEAPGVAPPLPAAPETPNDRLRSASSDDYARSPEMVINHANEENNVSQPFGDTEIQALRAIGLTEWESKAYLALLDEAPPLGMGSPSDQEWHALASMRFSILS